MIRRAVVQGTCSWKSLEEAVAAYMPGNYRVVGKNPDGPGVIIEGEDVLGWTLDDYVIPRLASGLYFAEEVRS